MRLINTDQSVNIRSIRVNLWFHWVQDHDSGILALSLQLRPVTVQFGRAVGAGNHFANGLGPDSAGVVGSDELRDPVRPSLVTGVDLFTSRITGQSDFDCDFVSGDARLRVVTTDLAFVHFLSLDWHCASGG